MLLNFFVADFLAAFFVVILAGTSAAVLAFFFATFAGFFATFAGFASLATLALAALTFGAFGALVVAAWTAVSRPE